MRRETICDSDIAGQAPGYQYATTQEEAAALLPWAAVVVRVCGGWRGWESLTDYSRDTSQG